MPSSLEDEAAPSCVALSRLRACGAQVISVDLGAKGKRGLAFVIALVHGPCMDATSVAVPTYGCEVGAK